MYFWLQTGWLLAIVFKDSQIWQSGKFVFSLRSTVSITLWTNEYHFCILFRLGIVAFQDVLEITSGQMKDTWKQLSNGNCDSFFHSLHFVNIWSNAVMFLMNSWLRAKILLNICKCLHTLDNYTVNNAPQNSVDTSSLKRCKTIYYLSISCRYTQFWKWIFGCYDPYRYSRERALLSLPDVRCRILTDFLMT